MFGQAISFNCHGVMQPLKAECFCTIVNCNILIVFESRMFGLNTCADVVSTLQPCDEDKKRRRIASRPCNVLVD